MKKVVTGILVCVALVVSACGSAGGSTTVTVFAAASLTESFTVLADRFEDRHPGVSVRLIFDGSSKLAQQLTEGAAADVLASADEKNMDKVVRAGRIAGSPTVFATNTLTAVVEPGNPKRITGFADLASPGMVVIRCARQVPCGAATDEVERRTGVRLSPASEEPDVKAVLTKVVTGEADAGLVYVSDAVAAAGKVDRVDIPEARHAVNSYPIARVRDSAQPALAREFLDLVLGPEGQRELRQAGFGAP